MVSKLQNLLESGHFVVCAELNPPMSADPGFIDKKIPHFGGFVDAVNVTDNPSSIIRMSSLAVSLHLLRNELEPIMQITCRDKNRLALQSEVLAAAAYGVRNILCVTGDHPVLGDTPSAKPVFDLDSVTLIQGITRMSAERRFIGGKEIKKMPGLFIGGVANPFAEPLEYRARRLLKKVCAGAAFIQTQPVFDLDIFRRWMASVRELGIHEKAYIIPGIMPLKSVKAARYMREKVPGVILPDGIVKRMEQARDPREEGIKIALETISAVRQVDGISGIHIMPVTWESIIPSLVSDSGLLPRPGGGSSGSLQEEG